jgi:hypothetical protein
MARVFTSWTDYTEDGVSKTLDWENMPGNEAPYIDAVRQGFIEVLSFMGDFNTEGGWQSKFPELIFSAGVPTDTSETPQFLNFQFGKAQWLPNDPNYAFWQWKRQSTEILTPWDNGPCRPFSSARFPRTRTLTYVQQVLGADGWDWVRTYPCGCMVLKPGNLDGKRMPTDYFNHSPSGGGISNNPGFFVVVPVMSKLRLKKCKEIIQGIKGVACPPLLPESKPRGWHGDVWMHTKSLEYSFAPDYWTGVIPNPPWPSAWTVTVNPTSSQLVCGAWAEREPPSYYVQYYRCRAGRSILEIRNLWLGRPGKTKTVNVWTYGKMPRSLYPNEAGWEYVYDPLGNAATIPQRWRKTNTITTTAASVHVPMFPLTEDADPRNYFVKPLPAVAKGSQWYYHFLSPPLPEHRGWLAFIGDYQIGYSWFFNNGLSIIEVLHADRVFG